MISDIVKNDIIELAIPINFYMHPDIVFLTLKEVTNNPIITKIQKFDL